MKRLKRHNKNPYKIEFTCIILLLLIITIGYSAFNTQLSFGAKGNIKTIAANQLKTKIVSSGDGLYQDNAEKNKYFFRGTNPNNYILLNNELYRIININENKTLRIIKNESIGEMIYDTQNSRYQGTNGYCNNNQHGCNIYGSSSNITNTNNLSTGKMFTATNQEEVDLPKEDSSINTYLNQTWFNTITDTNLITTSTYFVGPVEYQKSTFNQTLETAITQEKAYQWTGNVGLIEITDIPRTNSNQDSCGTISKNNYHYYNSKKSTCQETSWLIGTHSKWSMTPYSANDENNNTYGLFVIYNVCGTVNTWFAYAEMDVFPVITLKASITLKGSGTQSDPYIPSQT